MRWRDGQRRHGGAGVVKPWVPLTPTINVFDAAYGCAPVHDRLASRSGGGHACAFGAGDRIDRLTMGSAAVHVCCGE